VPKSILKSPKPKRVVRFDLEKELSKGDYSQYYFYLELQEKKRHRNIFTQTNSRERPKSILSSHNKTQKNLFTTSFTSEERVRGIVPAFQTGIKTNRDKNDLKFRRQELKESIHNRSTCCRSKDTTDILLEKYKQK